MQLDQLCRTITCRTPPSLGYADRGLCNTCENRGRDAIDGLPDIHHMLQPLVREKPSTGVGTTGGKFGPSVPLNLRADSFVRDIDYVTAQWAEIVRDRCDLSPALGTVADRCATMLAHWPVLISVREWPTVNPEGTIEILDGVDAIVRMTRLAALGGYTIGQDTQTMRIPGICPGCHRAEFRHRDGGDDIWCGNCRQHWSWTEYAAHVAMLGGLVP